MGNSTASMYYEIQVRGHIDPVWYEWCADAIVEQMSDGNTALLIRLSDQSALQGLLNAIQNSGLEIYSLNPLSDDNEQRLPPAGMPTISSGPFC